MEFGIMFFASSEDSLSNNIYDLVKKCTIYGDQNGFSSVWVPERHFTEFGGAYNNPAVLQAALSSITNRIRLNSGSVVMALHDPIRVAEEWAMVDNLSNGRAGIAIASGWNPSDFAFFPSNYKNKHEVMHRNLSVVRKLWKGETIDRLSGDGKMTPIRIYPSLVQEEIPLHLTVSGNPDGFRKGGELGINILTSVLDQTVEELAEKIKIYRQARLEHGFDPKAGKVSLMLHTYIGTDDEKAKEEARDPYCSFLKRNRKLFEGLAHNRDRSFSLSNLEEDELDDFVDFLYDRFTNTKGMIGDKESCHALVKEVMEAGVDEIVCLLDFGPPADKILENLQNIKELKEAYQLVEA
ncbi:MupA/Atu3671 family FMN-dependent luciferase-like monooxygenase [Aquimarina hainanensis]|uniref:MupA/Atu3671 family FMN-dependent luciferase-like monooxygenase n=1 Tax=Aquimarina hainanensis TaxID=1578017 RepID=A0ABW5N8H8_9FLAO|nr:MupA/Atu3671 family FMN-dependent luciferase-like monooxygenase [Aquimarina sp. TRL1]QKX03651.1 LLM class flavin-dependent oxidoreductase [Aquimarina sp. TRL1]